KAGPFHAIIVRRDKTGGNAVAAALWVKIIRHHRTDRQATVPCGRGDVREALLEACHELDLPEPLWLDKNEREWAEFGMTRFLPDAFFVFHEKLCEIFDAPPTPDMEKAALRVFNEIYTQLIDNRKQTAEEIVAGTKEGDATWQPSDSGP
ncbi:MAG: hypothetical protein IKH51_09760, partial [Clostridia bacterium]|nr:hypothetical protein [Clostridia bacterium]